MKLFTNCKSCKNEISFTSSCGTRVELAMKEGENMMLSCEECHVKNKYFINDIFAKKSKLLDITSTLIFLIGTPLLGYIGYNTFSYTVGAAKTGALMLIPIFLYTTVREQDRIRVNTFNRSYL